MQYLVESIFFWFHKSFQSFFMLTQVYKYIYVLKKSNIFTLNYPLLLNIWEFFDHLHKVVVVIIDLSTFSMILDRINRIHSATFVFFGVQFYYISWNVKVQMEITYVNTIQTIRLRIKVAMMMMMVPSNFR